MRCAGFMSSNIVRWIKSPGSGNMRDTLGPAQFPQGLDMARLKHELSNGTCLSPAAVEGLASVLQKKLHAFHFFELQLVRRQQRSSTACAVWRAAGMHCGCCAQVNTWGQVALLPSCLRRFESAAPLAASVRSGPLRCAGLCAGARGGGTGGVAGVGLAAEPVARARARGRQHSDPEHGCRGRQAHCWGGVHLSG